MLQVIIIAAAVALFLVFLMRQLYVWTKVSFYQIGRKFGLDKYWPVICVAVVAFYIVVVQPNMSSQTFLSDTLWGLMAVPCAVGLWVVAAQKFMKYTSTREYKDSFNQAKKDMKEAARRNNDPDYYRSTLNKDNHED